MDFANLGIKVDSTDVPKAEKELKSLASQGGRTERATDQLGSAFKRVAGPLAAFLGTRQIIASADAWTGLNNRLKIVTDSSNALVQAQDAVFQIAQESRQPLDATAQLYQRIAANQDALGISSAGIAGVVDTINKSIALSGTSAASASAALTQLGQGFASGTLRGEELNSVLEQAPALAQAIAEGMGKTTGELREMGKAGILTSDAVIKALESQGTAVDQKFGELTATVGQASTTFSNSITKVVGDINDATGASDGLSDSIIGISEYLDSGAFTNGILETMAIWRGTIDATIGATSDLSNEMELLGTVGDNAVGFIIKAMKELPANVTAITRAMTIEFASGFDLMKNHARLTVDTIKAIFSDDTADAVYQRFLEAEREIKSNREDSLQAVFDEREATLQLAAAQVKLREDERAARERERADREAKIAALRAEAEGGTNTAPVVDEEAQKRAEKLLDAYNDTSAALKEQVALFGEVGEAAQLRYQLENGDLAGLNDLQKTRLLQLAEELDALAAQQEFADKVQQIIEDSVPAAQKQVEDLRGQILTLKIAMDEGEISADQYSESVGHINEKIAQTLKDSDKFGKEVERLGSDIDTALLDGISGAIGGVKDWEEQFKASIARILIELVALKAAQAFGTTDTIGGDTGSLGVGGSILGSVFGGGGGGGGSSLLSGIGGFLGFKDSGGFVGAGQFAVGGERRPEIVTGPAHIIGGEETARLMSSSSTTNQITINMTGSPDDRAARKAGGVAGAAAASAIDKFRRYT